MDEEEFDLGFHESIQNHMSVGTNNLRSYGPGVGKDPQAKSFLIDDYQQSPMQRRKEQKKVENGKCLIY